MEYKINNFNLADISFEDAKSLSEYFEKSIYQQRIDYLLIGPNIININYSNEKISQTEENKKIINTLCRLVFFNLAMKQEQTFVMHTNSNLSAKSYLKKVLNDLNVLISEKIQKENSLEISKLLEYFDYISFFTTLKDDFDDEISICDFIVKMYYKDGELFYDSIQTLHENLGIICEKSENFNNLNIFYMLMYNLPLDYLGSFLLCDKTKEFFNVFSEQINVEDFIRRYIFINQFSLLQNKIQFENFVQSESNLDKIRNEYEYYRNLHTRYEKIKHSIGIKADQERKIFQLIFGILLVSEYDIFEDPKAKNIIERVAKNSKKVDSVSIIRSCLFSDFKFRMNSKSKTFEKKNDENINILQKIALNLNISEEKIVFILLTDLQNERINSNRQYLGRIRNEFIKTVYEMFLDGIKPTKGFHEVNNIEENNHNTRKNNRLSFLISRTNQVYISSYVSTLTSSKFNPSCETSRNSSRDYSQHDNHHYTHRDFCENKTIMVDKSIREAIYSNYIQELKNFLFFKNAVNTTSTLKESSNIKIEYNSNFVNKLINDIYSYSQLIDLYENNSIGLLLLMEDCSYLQIFIHQFRTKFHKSKVIELHDARYLKVRHTFGTFLYDLSELYKESSSLNHVHSSLKATIFNFFNYSPKTLIHHGVREIKRLAHEVVYMNFLIKVDKYNIKDVLDDYKIGNIYFFYNNFFNYNLDMGEIRKNLLKNAKNQFENSKLLKNDYVLFKSQIAKKFRISELEYYHENGLVYARKNFSRVLDYNKNVANLIFKYNHRMFYVLAVKNVLSSNFSPLRFAINSVRVYLSLIKVYKEKKIFITVKNLILDQIIEQFSIKRDSGEIALINEINKRQELKFDLSIENFSFILPKLFTYLSSLNNIWKNYFADIVFLEINKENFTNSNNIDMIIKERVTNLKILLFLFSRNYKFINADNQRKNGILHSAFIKNISQEILNMMRQLHESFNLLLTSNDLNCTKFEKNISLEKLITTRLCITQPRQLHSNSIYKLENDSLTCPAAFDGFTDIYCENPYYSNKINQSNCMGCNVSHNKTQFPNVFNAELCNALTDTDRKTVYLRRLSNTVKVIIDDDLYQNLGKNSIKLSESFKVNSKQFKDGDKIDSEDLMNLYDFKGVNARFNREKNKNTFEIINELLEERSGNKNHILRDDLYCVESSKVQGKSEKIEKEILKVNIDENNPEMFSNYNRESKRVDDSTNPDAIKEKDDTVVKSKSIREKEIDISLIKEIDKNLNTAGVNSLIDKKDEKEDAEIQQRQHLEVAKIIDENKRKLDVSKKENRRKLFIRADSTGENQADNLLNICIQENENERLSQAFEDKNKEYNSSHTLTKINEKRDMAELKEKVKKNNIAITENLSNGSTKPDKYSENDKKEKIQLIPFEKYISITDSSKEIQNFSFKSDRDNIRYGTIDPNYHSTNKDDINNNEYNSSSKSLICSNDSKISSKSISNDNPILNKFEPIDMNNKPYNSGNDLRSQSNEFDSKVNYSDGNFKMKKIKSLMELKLEDYVDFISEPREEPESSQVNNNTDEELDNTIEKQPDNIVEFVTVVSDRNRENDVIKDEEELANETEINLVDNIEESFYNDKIKELTDVVDSNNHKRETVEYRKKKGDENKLSLEKFLEKKNNLYRNKILAKKNDEETKEEDELKLNEIQEDNNDIKSEKIYHENRDKKNDYIFEEKPEIKLNNLDQEKPEVEMSNMLEDEPEIIVSELNEEKSEIETSKFLEGKVEIEFRKIPEDKLERKLNTMSEDRPEIKASKIIECKPDIKENNRHEDKSRIELENMDEDEPEIKLGKINEDKPEIKLNNTQEEIPELKLGKINEEKPEIKSNNIHQVKSDLILEKFHEEKSEIRLENINNEEIPEIKLDSIPEIKLINIPEVKTHRKINSCLLEKFKLEPNYKQDDNTYNYNSEIQNDLFDKKFNENTKEKNQFRRNKIPETKPNIEKINSQEEEPLKYIKEKNIEEPNQKKENIELIMTNQKLEISSSKLEDKEERNLLNKIHNAIVEETLENIVKENVLNEDEDFSKDSYDFVFPEKSEKLDYKDEKKSVPNFEKIQNQLIEIENKENHNLFEILKLDKGENIVEKTIQDVDDKIISRQESISVDSQKKIELDDGDKLKLKSAHNSFEIQRDEKLEDYNEKVEENVSKRTEVPGKAKRRKNYKTKYRKRTHKIPSKKQDHVEIEKELEKSREILQNNELIKSNDDTENERLKNADAELLNEINQKSLLDYEEKNILDFGKNTIDEKLESKLNSAEVSICEETKSFAIKPYDAEEKKSEIEIQEVIERPEVKDDQQLIPNSLNQSIELPSNKSIISKENNSNEKVDHNNLQIIDDQIYNNVSNPDQKTSENFEFDPKEMKQFSGISNKNNKIRKTHRKLHTAKFRMKKKLSLGEIDTDSINLNDEDFNKIIPKQSGDLSHIYLDLNNHMMGNLQSDVLTPTFVKMNENKIKYDRYKEDEEDSKNLEHIESDNEKDINVSFKKETEDELEDNNAEINKSQYYSSLRSKCREVINEVEAEYENEEPTIIRLTQLHELDRQIELLKANLDDLSFLNCVTETTSEMLVTKQDLENRAVGSVLNERRGANSKIYSDIFEELRLLVNDFPEILKY